MATKLIFDKADTSLVPKVVDASTVLSDTQEEMFSAGNKDTPPGLTKNFHVTVAKAKHEGTSFPATNVVGGITIAPDEDIVVIRTDNDALSGIYEYNNLTGAPVWTRAEYTTKKGYRDTQRIVLVAFGGSTTIFYMPFQSNFLLNATGWSFKEVGDAHTKEDLEQIVRKIDTTYAKIFRPIKQFGVTSDSQMIGQSFKPGQYVNLGTGYIGALGSSAPNPFRVYVGKQTSSLTSILQDHWIAENYANAYFSFCSPVTLKTDFFSYSSTDGFNRLYQLDNVLDAKQLALGWDDFLVEEILSVAATAPAKTVWERGQMMFVTFNHTGFMAASKGLNMFNGKGLSNGSNPTSWDLLATPPDLHGKEILMRVGVVTRKMMVDPTGVLIELSERNVAQETETNKYATTYTKTLNFVKGGKYQKVTPAEADAIKSGSVAGENTIATAENGTLMKITSTGFFSLDGQQEVSSAGVAAPSFTNANAMALDGVDDHLDASGLLPVLTTLTQGTVAAWVFVTGAGANTLFSIERNTPGIGDNFLFKCNGTDINGGIRGASNVLKWRFDSTFPNALSSNAWHHIALVQDGVSPKFYIDGNLIAMTADPGNTDVTAWFSAIPSPIFNKFGLRVSQGGFQEFPYQGRADEVAYWSNALSAAEITVLKVEPIKLTEANGAYASQGSLLAHYRMGDGLGESGGIVQNEVTANADGTLTNGATIVALSTPADEPVFV